MLEKNSTIKYFLYARKSSESEERQMASIDDQIIEMKRLAEKRGLEIVDVIIESKSAKAPGREKFNTLLERIHRKEANGILTWKLNRLARNPIDGGQISWMLQQNIIQHIQTYGADYHPTDNVLLMQIEFGMATQYVKDLSVSVCRGMRLKAERGWFPASQLPTGYMRNPKRTLASKNRDIIPDKKRFKIVQKLWKDALTGDYTITEIKHKALIQGLRNRKGNAYGNSFFYRLFQNEFYYGYFYWKNEDGKLVRYKGKHQPMVTEKEFKTLQLLLFGNNPRKKDPIDLFVFRGILQCDECNRRITAQRKLQCICTVCRRKFSCKVKTSCPDCYTEMSAMKTPSIIDQTYYHCSNPRNKCPQLPVNEKQLNRQVKALLKSISISEEFYNVVTKEITTYIKVNSKNENDKTAAYRNDVQTLEKRLKRLTILRINEEIGAEEFQVFKAEITTSINKTRTAIEALEKEQAYGIEEQQKYLDVANGLLKRFEKGTIEVKKQLLSKFSSNLTLKNKNLYFSMPKALFTLLLCYEDYAAKKEELEPKKNLVFKRDLVHFPLFLLVGEPTGEKLEPKITRLAGETDLPDNGIDAAA